MLVPLDWLREYCDPALSTEALAARLTLTGTQVERTLRHGPPSAEHYVVGRVLACEQHPDADRLRVCRVDVGEPAPVTIVCGAPNVAAGQTVPVARPGAHMADGRTLGAAKLRGIVSDGMILATDEIALGGDHAGILVLDDGPAPGTPLASVLPLGTDVLELEVTPNRPDCLAVYGVAREVHAATGAPLAAPPWLGDAGSPGGAPAGVRITVECPDLCPRFTARVFEGVTIGPSPMWLAARLLAAGQRPISNVVDITNYVMLLSGQPVHAFDLDRVAGAQLTVRRARAGEGLETLDGQTRTLEEGMVVICDDDGPTSLGGIMGGARSEVGDGTTRVLLEAANWDGATVQRTGLALGVRSEASSRFEKGLSRLLPLEAQAVASALFVELCGARLLPGTIDVGGPGPSPDPIVLRPARVAAVLGAAVAPERCEEILRALGFEVAAGLRVSVPHFRWGDVTREVDLIEEVARIDGLERLPATLPPRRGAAGRLTHAQRVRRRAEDALAARGLSEVAGWSFADPALGDRLRLAPEDPMRRVVEIENPLSESQSVMRPTLLGSLLDAAAHNAARGVADLALFESGTVFRAGGEGPLADEHHGLAILLVGRSDAESWRGGAATAADFFAAKGLLAAVLDAVGVVWSVAPQARPFLHPGRAAVVNGGPEDRQIGFLGELHPLVAGAWDLEQAAVWAVDLGVVASLAPEVVAYQPFAVFPSVREDLAVVVGEDVAAAAVVALVRRAAGAELARALIFDVYRGAQVGEGRVSLALHLEFRAADRTLTDAEVADARARIAQALADELGGELRG